MVQVDASPPTPRFRLGLLTALLLGGACLAPAPARAEDADIFSFLRNALGGPPAARPQVAAPPPAVRPRAPTRRDYIRSHARRDDPAFGLDGARRASDPFADGQGRGSRRREHYAALKPPPAVDLKAGWREPDLSGEVDEAFLARETKAYENALSGRGEAYWMAGRQTMCVRLCDGFAFPVGELRSVSDLSVHRGACQATCPGADTVMFSRPSGDSELREAISLGGRPYASLKTAFAFRMKKVAACACTGEGAKPYAPFKIERDQTVRVGDAVMGKSTLFVLTAGRIPKFADYRKDKALSRSARAQIQSLIGSQTPRASVRVQLSASDEAPPSAPEPGLEPAPEATASAETEVRVVLPRIY